MISKERWRYLYALALACTAVTTSAQAADVQYVQGSRASLRAQANAGAPVSGYLTANTQVRVVSRAGDWCDVEVQPRGSGDSSRGRCCPSKSSRWRRSTLS